MTINQENRPEDFLPRNHQEWRRRVTELVAELRRDDLAPCREFLYQRDSSRQMAACVEGVINDMAIRGGVPAQWTSTQISPEGERTTVWKIWRETDASTTRQAIPEALLYHGLDMPDGRLHIDVLECAPDFIKNVVNRQHRVRISQRRADQLNHNLTALGQNPLRLTADILEHLLDRPHRSVWHGAINQWAQ